MIKTICANCGNNKMQSLFDEGDTIYCKNCCHRTRKSDGKDDIVLCPVCLHMRDRKALYCMWCNHAWGDGGEYDQEEFELANKFEETIDETNIRYFKLKRYNYLKKSERTDKEKEIIYGSDRIIQSKTRINHDKFKEILLKKYCKCQLCNIQTQELLIASHIKPWAVCNAAEKTDPDNGLLLCPNHDRLFDQGLISFSDNGDIIISRLLNDPGFPIEELNKHMKIDVTENRIKYLKYHREHVFRQ